MADAPKYAYRTEDPETINAVREAFDSYSRWLEEIEGFAKSFHPDAEPVMDRIGGFSPRFKAVRFPYDIEELPSGWRKDGKTGWCVPRASTKAGKALNERFNELNNSLIWVLDVIRGMPRTGGLLGGPGLSLVEEDGPSVLVIWAVEPGGEVDDSIWESIPLSRYYGILEAREG